MFRRNCGEVDSSLLKEKDLEEEVKVLVKEVKDLEKEAKALEKVGSEEKDSENIDD